MKQHKIKVIIIDDQLESINYLINLLEIYFIDEIEILKSYTSTNDALKEISKLNPDVIFLDIEMPEMDGFEFKSLLPNDINSKVIIVTGQENYALKAIKSSVFDYILKPLTISDLRNCINKIKLSMSKSAAQSELDSINNIIVVNRQDKTLFIEIDKINRIEASGSYTNIYFDENKISSTKNLNFYESILPNNKFFRAHRSYLININFVKEVLKNEGEGVLVLKDNTKIELSRAKKDDFLRLFIKN